MTSLRENQNISKNLLYSAFGLSFAIPAISIPLVMTQMSNQNIAFYLSLGIAMLSFTSLVSCAAIKFANCANSKNNEKKTEDVESGIAEDSTPSTESEKKANDEIETNITTNGNTSVAAPSKEECQR